MFNDCIADMGLRELDRVGARFTWTNRQAELTRLVLDRVYASPEWDIHCPLALLRAITWIGSDHVPILLSSENERPPAPPRFHFETFWLNQNGFIKAVRDRWGWRPISLPIGPYWLSMIGNSVPSATNSS